MDLRVDSMIRKRLILVLVIDCLVRVCDADQFLIETASNLTALSDSLDVKWRWVIDQDLIENGTRRDESQVDFLLYFIGAETRERVESNKPICTQSVGIGASSGQLTFPCSCFPFGGNYELSVDMGAESEEGNHSQVSSLVSAELPSVIASIPSQHRTLDGPVTLTLAFDSPLCPPKRTPYHTVLEIIHRNENDAGAANENFYLLQSIEVADIWSLNRVSIPCRYFDRAGYFKVRLSLQQYATPRGSSQVQPLDRFRMPDHRWNLQWSQTVAQSSEMHVVWDGTYKIQMKGSGIFPCGTTKVRKIPFVRPPCHLEGDRIRVYKIVRRDGGSLSVKRPARLEYMRELKIPPKNNSLQINCGVFDNFHPGFCFKYVSVLHGGLVKERATQCVPSDDRPYSPVDGEWSSWQEFGACSVSCGSGVQHRIRSCDNPRPLHGGAFCKGAGVLSRVCNQETCSNETSRRSVKPHRRCQCGCNLTSPGLLVIHSGLCSHSALWFVKAQSPTQSIRFRMTRIRLRPSDHIRIRQGQSRRGTLLLDSDLSGMETGVWVESGGGVIRIEYEARGEGTESGDLSNASPRSYLNDISSNWNGLILSFQSIDDFSESEKSPGLQLWDGNVREVLIGTGIGVAVLLLLTFFGSWFWWHTRKRMAENLMLLSTESRESQRSSSFEPTSHPKLAILRTPTGNSHPVCSTKKSPKKSSSQISVEREATEPLIPNSGERESGKRLSRIMENSVEEMHTSTTTGSTRLSQISQRSVHISPERNTINRRPDKNQTKEELRRAWLSPENEELMGGGGGCGASPSVAKRSIGIQLNSPALPLRRFVSMESKISTTSAGGNQMIQNPNPTGNGMTNPMIGSTSTNGHSGGRESPISFCGTEQDFEYDYYEPNLPGSYLTPFWRTGHHGEDFVLESEIDIDDIIGDSELMRTPTRSSTRDTTPAPHNPLLNSRNTSTSDYSDKSTQMSIFAPGAVTARSSSGSSEANCDSNKNFMSTFRSNLKS